MRRLGFTLLELLCALALIAIVAGVAIPLYFSRSDVTLENAAVLLARDLRIAQNHAAYTREPVVFALFADGDGYWVLDALGQPLIHPTTGLPFVRRYSADGVFRGVVVRGGAFGDDQRVVFDELGRPEEGGYVALGFEGDSREVVVGAGDGRITIVGSTSGWVDDGL